MTKKQQTDGGSYSRQNFKYGVLKTHETSDWWLYNIIDKTTSRM